VLSPSSFVRFLPPDTSAFAPGAGAQEQRLSSDFTPGAEKSEKSLRSDLSGLSMLSSHMPSLELMQRMRKSLSPEELQAAFARRCVAHARLLRGGGGGGAMVLIVCACQLRSCLRTQATFAGRYVAHARGGGGGNVLHC
jgi:hypothetical protein